MTAPESRSVVVEREMPFPPARVWRALTDPALVSEWLMRADAAPDAPGRRFTLAGDWGSVACEVTEVEPERRLAYTWAAFGLDSTVTWTLTPTATGTRLRMEQAGFAPGQDQFLSGAEASWPGFLGRLEEVVARG